MAGRGLEVATCKDYLQVPQEGELARVELLQILQQPPPTGYPAASSIPPFFAKGERE
jgi:hypothetical protein